MRISIIIPNYNGKHLLEKNLPRVIKEIAKLRNFETEVIIVDDGSSDDSVKFIKELTSWRVNEFNNSLINNKPIIKLIKNEKNLGFSATVNRGVRAASGEVVVLLNTDVYPEEGFLKAVLPHFKDPKVFAVGMLDKSIENEEIVRRGRGIAEWRRGFYIHRRGEINKTDTAWVSGGSGVFRRSIFLKFGGFDEIYNPFYWEDIDLSYRALKDGYKILFEPKSCVVHKHEEGVIKSKFPPWKIKSISFRNQFLFVWKNANLGQFFSHFLWLPQHIVKSILTADICFLIGLLWAIQKKLTFRS